MLTSRIDPRQLQSSRQAAICTFDSNKISVIRRKGCRGRQGMASAVDSDRLLSSQLETCHIGHSVNLSYILSTDIAWSTPAAPVQDDFLPTLWLEKSIVISRKAIAIESLSYRTRTPFHLHLGTRSCMAISRSDTNRVPEMEALDIALQLKQHHFHTAHPIMESMSRTINDHTLGLAFHSLDLSISRHRLSAFFPCFATAAHINDLLVPNAGHLAQGITNDAPFCIFDV